MNHWENNDKNNIKDEKWLPVLGYDYKYSVSSFGRVKNIITGNIVKQHKRRGYLSLTLIDKYGKAYYTKAHKLVANAFVNNPNAKPYVNHKDFNRENNTPNNLEWVTAQENMDHMKDAKRSLFGVKNPSCILTNENVLEIRRLRKNNKVKDIAKWFGVSIPTIEAVIYGRTWKHL